MRSDMQLENDDEGAILERATGKNNITCHAREK